MKEFFKELFQYCHHSNQQIAELFLQHSESITEKSRKLFSHTLNAQHIWNARLSGNKPDYSVWEIHPVESFKNMDLKNHMDTFQLLNTIDLSNMIDYTNSKGERFSNTVRDILFHVVNHSTYHRGQIASDFKQQGFEPPVTDYIFYKR